MSFELHLRRRFALGLLAASVAGMAWAAPSQLQVQRITPGGTNVPAGQEVVIQFDRPMVALGAMARTPSQVPVTIAPDPGCQWRWLDVSELACRLPGKRTLRPATHYRVHVGTDMAALDGARLAKPVQRRFTTLRPKVDWPQFLKWRSSVAPVYLLRFNLPVTAAAVEKSLYFSTPTGPVAVRAVPYGKRRSGPLYLPVPDAPGAMVAIDEPSPAAPLDAGTPAGQPRRQWQVSAVVDLPGDSDFSLASHGDLITPLGPLPGTEKNISGGMGHTFGPFKVVGIQCQDAANHPLSIGVDADASGRCRPGSVQLAFNVPVIRATLVATKWQPVLADPGERARQWANYADYYLHPPYGANPPMDGTTYPLPFTLKAMQGYALTVPAGVRDQFGRALVKAQTVSFNTGHRAPFFRGPPSQVVLEAGEPTIAPLRYTNLQQLDFDYQLLHAADLPNLGGVPSLILWRQSASVLGGNDASHAPDRIVSGKLGLRELLGGRSGVAWGRLRWSPQEYGGDQTFFGEVTPYQVFAKVGLFDTLVWVNTFKGGGPVAGAKVTLYRAPKSALDSLDPQSKTVLTNADGLAVLPGSNRFGQDWFKQWADDAQQRYIGVTDGGSMALLPLIYSFQRSVGQASDYAVSASTAPRYGHMRIWAVTDQGIYQPGSSVRFDVFARNPGSVVLEPAPALDYTLSVDDALGNTVLKREHVKLSAFGDVSDALRVPKTAPTGWYTINLAWQDSTGTTQRQAGRFLVTEFVPASFQVQAMLEGDRFGPGARITAQVQAKLHAGGPYTDAKTRLSTRIAAEAFAPDVAPASGFSFQGNPDDAPDSTEAGESQGQLDQDGRSQTVVQLPANTDIQYGQVRFEAAVQSSRGTWVAGRAHALYTSRDRFIGLRTREWAMQAGTAADVQYLVADTDGKPQAGSAVQLVLERQQIKQVRVKNGAGDFDTEQHVSWVAEDRCSATSGTAPGNCKLTPHHPGSYRIVGTVTDTRGKHQVNHLRTWATGAGEVLWPQDKAVTLVPDKAAYQAGDTAHVLVQNPFPGAQALVTVERYGVLWQKVLTLAGSAPVIDVPIGPHFFPGAYLSVTVFSPRASAPANPDLGKPEVGLGYVALKIAPHQSPLSVKVTPSAATFKPRQRVQVQVNVQRRAGGYPGRTRLVAIAVDQSVVDLLEKGSETFNPLPTFQAPPDGPDVENFSLAEQLLSLLMPKSGKGENPGGGGGMGPHVRSRIDYGAYWNAQLVTATDGKTQFAFTLPDNLTRWRIFVIAMRPGDEMGFGDASVRASLPIQVQGALPNQVHVGDEFGAGFEVTNRTDQAHAVVTTISATGTAIDPQAAAHDTLSLDSFGHAIAWTHLVARQPGSITLIGSATAGALGDSLRKSIPVTRAGAEETAAQYGSVTDGAATVPIKLSDDALPGSATLAVSLSPTLVGNLEGAFVSLRDNPLRTWETRLSRSVLAADYVQLKPYLGDSVAWPDADAVITKALDSAADFQASDGGMVYWIPRKDFVSPYLSVYTALAFNWLQRAGNTVPANVREKLDSYLRQQILGGKDRAINADTAPVLKAGALAALAGSGKLEKGAVAAMLPQLQQLDVFGQGLLLQAALDQHDVPSAKAIVEAILAHGETSAGSLSLNERQSDAYAEILATPLRANCEVLDALVEAKRQGDTANHLDDTAQKLMRWVIGQRRNAGGWPNTQENVFCTTAIAHYAQVFEPPVSHLAGAIRAPGLPGKALAFPTASAPAKSLSTTLTDAKPFHVALGHGGSGRLYYNVRLSYALPPYSVGATDAGMTIARSYAVQRGKDWVPVTDATTLQRGDVVQVSLDVDTPTERHHVVLTDPLPGTFEAVNRQLATAMQSTPVKGDARAVLMFDAGPWPNESVTVGGFYHRETALDAVRFFADDLPAGHYRLVYAAQVLSPGQFIAPAPKIEAIYQPDIFGRGAAQHLNVAQPGG